MESCKFGNRQG